MKKLENNKGRLGQNSGGGSRLSNQIITSKRTHTCGQLTDPPRAIGSKERRSEGRRDFMWAIFGHEGVV